jgi:hypothetical protein
MLVTFITAAKRDAPFGRWPLPPGRPAVLRSRMQLRIAIIRIIGSGQKPAADQVVRSTVCEWHSDITRRIAGSEAHQHAGFLAGARHFERLADISGFGNALSGNF